MNRDYAMIIQEERHRNVTRSKDEHNDVGGFLAQAGTKSAAVTKLGRVGTVGELDMRRPNVPGYWLSRIVG